MTNVQPKVHLVNSDGFIDACVAAKNCVTSDSVDQIYSCFENAWSDKDGQKLLKSVIIDNGHEAIAEFIHFTFALENVNLATLAQYSRHRLQSLAVKSQRYITHKELVTALPDYMENDQRTIDLFNRSYDLYLELIEGGMKVEDARLVLPQACATTIICKMNARELIHIIEERECTCTQSQHRDVATQMHDLAKGSFGFIFDHVGPKCYRLGRCPEKRNSKGCKLYKNSIHYKG